MFMAGPNNAAQKWKKKKNEWHSTITRNIKTQIQYISNWIERISTSRGKCSYDVSTERKYAKELIHLHFDFFPPQIRALLDWSIRSAQIRCRFQLEKFRSNKCTFLVWL